MRKPKTRMLILLTAAVFAISAALSLVICSGGAGYVEIYEGGALVGKYPIDVDRTVTLKHNVVRIEGGSVCMVESDCKNRICVNTGVISSPLYPIVCLPNRVMVRVTGGGGADASAGD